MTIGLLQVGEPLECTKELRPRRGVVVPIVNRARVGSLKGGRKCGISEPDLLVSPCVRKKDLTRLRAQVGKGVQNVCEGLDRHVPREVLAGVDAPVRKVAELNWARSAARGLEASKRQLSAAWTWGHRHIPVQQRLCVRAQEEDLPDSGRGDDDDG